MRRGELGGCCGELRLFSVKLRPPWTVDGFQKDVVLALNGSQLCDEGFGVLSRLFSCGYLFLERVYLLEERGIGVL